MTLESSALMHVDPADLVRLMDGELSAPEAAAVVEHLSRCAECASRQDLLRRQATAISQLLRSADLPAPATSLRVTVMPATPRRWASVRAAAVIALLIGGAVAVPPVRAWIANVARVAWARVTGESTRVEPRPGGTGTTEAGAVSFVPAGVALTIRVPARAGARLILETVEGNRVTAVGINGHAVPGLVVLPEELRLGLPSDSSDYLVRIPAGLTGVRVMVGIEKPRTVRPGLVGERTVIPL